MKNLRLIKTESEYNISLKRIEVIYDAEEGTSESDELDILCLLISE